MGKQENESQGFGLPIWAMIVVGVLGGLVVGASMVAIKYWPLPVSVAPYFGFRGGFAWGAVVGGIAGLVLGFLTDDKHFADS